VEAKIKGKLLLLDDLVDKVSDLKKSGKTVVQSHGVFDLIHPGVIKHLKSAKKEGDILVVTVIKDSDVRRGSGRPIFPDKFRAENVASLEYVDYVSIVDDKIPFECVKRIKPDIFAKGQAYKERDRKIHEKIFEEEREFYFGKSRIYETDGFSFSSSQIINNFLDIYPEETKYFLKDFSRRYSFQDIVEAINQLKSLKILLIGDGIIDEYHYCASLGKSAKAHLVVNKYLTHEVFAGGAFAIANHMAGFCSNVHLVTLLGKEDSREDFILKNLKPNISTQFFYRDKGPTIVKKRYINQYLNQKLFEINYIEDENINGDCESGIISYLKTKIPEYDLILVSDFGHGFITGRIIQSIEESAQKYAVNTQTNAANRGYNLITKYKNPFYVCLDEPECRLAAQDKHGNIEDIVRNIKKEINAKQMIVTLGKKGSIGINGREDINRTPIFSSKVVDTVGAGDAFFAFTAPCFAYDLPMDIVSFIGNAVGALAVQITGNKKAVERHELLEFIYALLK
jgi:rfaE bifunctional protein kinase chain/domain